MNDGQTTTFIVHQGVFTVSFWYALDNLFSSGLWKLAKAANSVVRNWIKEVGSSPLRVNVIITDFSITGYPNFTEDVIRLNYRIF